MEEGSEEDSAKREKDGKTLTDIVRAARLQSEVGLKGFSGERKSTKINFLGPEIARWGGGLPCEGVVAEKWVPALESLSSLGFEERNLGCPGNFAVK